MAIDTRNKRASCLGIDGAYRAVFPNPDGAISAQADRQQIAGKYPGILAGAAGGVVLAVLGRAIFRMMAGGMWRRLG